MYLEKVERVGQIKADDQLLYIGLGGSATYGKVKEVVRAGVSAASNGEEILLKRNKGAYFLMASYLEGCSWVKDCYILRAEPPVPAHVVIDGIPYVPRAYIPPLNDARLQEALSELVAIQYFNEEHKNRAKAWNVLNALAPELAELAAHDPAAAYHRVHGDAVTADTVPSPSIDLDRLRDIEQPWCRNV